MCATSARKLSALGVSIGAISFLVGTLVGTLGGANDDAGWDGGVYGRSSSLRDFHIRGPPRLRWPKPGPARDKNRCNLPGENGLCELYPTRRAAAIQILGKKRQI